MFVSIANITLVRRDSYLAHVKSGLKQDTVAALRQALLTLPILFPDSVLRKVEEDISKFKDKGCTPTQSAGWKDSCYHPNRRSDRQPQEQKSDKPALKILERFSKQKVVRQSDKYSSCLAKDQSPYKRQLLCKCSSTKVTDPEQRNFKIC